MSHIGKVYLVGGGPGDPGLLTVRAKNLMSQVDVVAYDALISPALLALVPQHVEMVSIGYRGYNCKIGYGMHPEVIELALQGKDVLRLKAGDPFIFGRGTQECDDLLQHNIPFEVVPGISSALGAGAYAGFPLTSTGMASDVTFASGHMSSESKPSWQAMGQGTGTLALYMAAKKIRRNCQTLIDLGRSPDTPAIYISSATTSDQFELEGTLATLADKVEVLNITAPALIIIGEVVNLRERFNWRQQLPLAGQRALVAREGETGDRLQQSLENQGAIVIRSPAGQLRNDFTGDDFKKSLEARQLIFTGEQAVHSWYQSLSDNRVDIRSITQTLFATSPEVISALETLGFFSVNKVSYGDLASFDQDACVLTEASDILLNKPSTTEALIIRCCTRIPAQHRFDLPEFDLAIIDDKWSYGALANHDEGQCLNNARIYTSDAGLSKQLLRQQLNVTWVTNDDGLVAEIVSGVDGRFNLKLAI